MGFVIPSRAIWNPQLFDHIANEYVEAVRLQTMALPDQPYENR
jgi:hypothetical protein